MTPEPTPYLEARTINESEGESRVTSFDKGCRRRITSGDHSWSGITNETYCHFCILDIFYFSCLRSLFPNPPLKVTEEWRLPRGKIKQRFVIIIIDISPRAVPVISRKLVLENSPGWLRRWRLSSAMNPPKRIKLLWYPYHAIFQEILLIFFLKCIHTYKGISIEKFPHALALLLHKIYSSYWGHMKALGILLNWGYGSLDSTKKWLNDRPKCEGHFVDHRVTQKYAWK